MHNKIEHLVRTRITFDKNKFYSIQKVSQLKNRIKMILKDNLMGRTIIAAVSKEQGSAIHIIRLSGIEVIKVLEYFEKGLSLNIKSKHVYLHNYRGGSRVLDQINFVFYKKPSSYTGEDMLEIFNHGSTTITNCLVKDLIKRFGLRTALEGEFTKRAFVNRKVDLTQANSIYKLTGSTDVNSLYGLNKGLSGILSQTIKFVENHMRSLILGLEGSVENRLLVTNTSNVLSRVNFLRGLIRSLVEKNELLVFKKVDVSIIGSPNVGKSSTLNTLFKKKLSIVSSLRGTTRDTITKDFKVVPISFIDTAGIHQLGVQGLNLIGVSNTLKKIKKTGFYLWVLDFYTETRPLTKILSSLLKRINTVIMLNKSPSYTLNKGPLYLKVFLKKFKYFRITNTSLVNVPAGVKKLKFLLFLNLKTLLCKFNRGGKWAFLLTKRQLTTLNQTYVTLRLLSEGNVGSVKKLILIYSRLKKIKELGGSFNNRILVNSIFSKFCVGK